MVERPLPLVIGDQLCLLGKSNNIENERHLAIAQNRRPGIKRDALEMFTEWFSNDLLRVADAVNNQAESSTASLEHDDIECMASCLGKSTIA